MRKSKTKLETIKAAGFKTVAEVVALSGESESTIERSFKYSSDRFILLMDRARQANTEPMCQECFERAIKDYLKRAK